MLRKGHLDIETGSLENVGISSSYDFLKHSCTTAQPRLSFHSRNSSFVERACL